MNLPTVFNVTLLCRQTFCHWPCSRLALCLCFEIPSSASPATSRRFSGGLVLASLFNARQSLGLHHMKPRLPGSPSLACAISIELADIVSTSQVICLDSVLDAVANTTYAIASSVSDTVYAVHAQMWSLAKGLHRRYLHTDELSPYRNHRLCAARRCYPTHSNSPPLVSLTAVLPD